jgi:hypothetical protein
MAAFHHHHPTSFDVALNTFTAADATPSCWDKQPAVSSPYESQSPIPFPALTIDTVEDEVPRPSLPCRRSSSTPVPSQILNRMVDPDLYTPHKRMRVMSGTLSGTSGLFLVSKDPIASAQHVAPLSFELRAPGPQPNWMLAAPSVHNPDLMTKAGLEEQLAAMQAALWTAHQRNAAQQSMLEAAHALSIVQNLHLDKINQQLLDKESRKDNKQAVFFEGRHRQVLTDPTFRTHVEAVEAERKAKETAKAAIKMSCAAKRVANAQAKLEWECIKAEHERAVAAWEEEVTRLKQANVWAKDLPEHPVRPLKPISGQPLRTRALQRRRAANSPSSALLRASAGSSFDSRSNNGWRTDSDNDL